MSAQDIENWIAIYRRENPSLEPPELSDHPLVVALMTEVHPKIIDDFGGVVPCWWALFRAVTEWYPEPSEAFEYAYFRTRLFSACGMANNGDYEQGMNEIWQAFQKWKQSK
jgi:hypothetical protein